MIITIFSVILGLGLFYVEIYKICRQVVKQNVVNYIISMIGAIVIAALTAIELEHLIIQIHNL